MRTWDDCSRKVQRRRPDPEQARALLKMAALRKRDVESKGDEFCVLIVEGYYEILKELMTALLTVDGLKTTSHECLIAYVERHCTGITGAEVHLLDQLRRMRNDISYRGVMVDPEYLERNRDRIRVLIGKLRCVVETRLQT